MYRSCIQPCRMQEGGVRGGHEYQTDIPDTIESISFCD